MESDLGSDWGGGEEWSSWDEAQEPAAPAAVAAPTARAPPPTPHTFHFHNLLTFHYPTNLPPRAYQTAITTTALLHNTLVCLPTGLGKTLVAATLMLNYYRWCSSTILFLAPTRPLVAQQLQACVDVAGLPLDESTVLLNVPKQQRIRLYQTHRLFFSTPQTIWHDISLGALDITKVCLIVFDEAHRTRGAYAYARIAERVAAVAPHSVRLVGLSATPGADAAALQMVVDTLRISRVEFRSDSSPDVAPYVNNTTVERIELQEPAEIAEMVLLLAEAIAPVLKSAYSAKVYPDADPTAINAFKALEASKRVSLDHTLPEGRKWKLFYTLRLLGEVGTMYARLRLYGVRSFYAYLRSKHALALGKFGAGRSTNETAHGFYASTGVRRCLQLCQGYTKEPGYRGHPKMDALVETVADFVSSRPDSRVLVFTELRESALDIVRVLEQAGTRPHVFIGQSGSLDEGVPKVKAKRGFEETAEAAAAAIEAVAPEELDTLGPFHLSSCKVHATGMLQAVQKQTLAAFKQGTYNTLVCTLIGEEGLDIGEVDMVVCFDSTLSPIKNIQRMGRTGRRREGKVVLLFSGNELSKFDRAMQGYAHVQQAAVAGVATHEQVRVLPAMVDPKFTEVKVERGGLEGLGDEEVLAIARDIVRAADTKQSRKANGKAGRNAGGKAARNAPAAKVVKPWVVPEGAETRFMSARSVLAEVDSRLRGPSACQSAGVSPAAAPATSAGAACDLGNKSVPSAPPAVLCARAVVADPETSVTRAGPAVSFSSDSESDEFSVLRLLYSGQTPSALSMGQKPVAIVRSGAILGEADNGAATKHLPDVSSNAAAARSASGDAASHSNPTSAGELVGEEIRGDNSRGAAGPGDESEIDSTGVLTAHGRTLLFANYYHHLQELEVLDYYRWCPEFAADTARVAGTGAALGRIPAYLSTRTKRLCCWALGKPLRP